MSAGSREARASRTLPYTGLKLAEFTGGRAKSAPFKEFRQPYFGSLPEDNNTFSGETPPSDFSGEPAIFPVGAGLPRPLCQSPLRLPASPPKSSRSPPPPSKPDQSPHLYTRPPPHPHSQSQFSQTAAARSPKVSLPLSNPDRTANSD